MTSAPEPAPADRRLGGAVLTGGRSSRMGATKALVDVDGVAMASRVASAARLAGARPVVLVGGDADELAPLGLPVVADLHPGAGPLGGVLSALGVFGDLDGVMVLACDLPFFDADSARRLVAASAAHPDAVVVAHGQRPEPACAIWPTATHPAVLAAFEAGERSLSAMQERLGTLLVDVAAERVHNVNSPADLVTGRSINTGRPVPGDAGAPH